MGNRGNLAQLRVLGPALRRVAKERRILVKVVAPLALGMEGVPLECATHPWSPESERRDLASFDVGLLPLVDDAQTRGKFPLKLLQYSATGLPTVASPVAIDRKAFIDGESILFASSEEEWVSAILRLVDDVALRTRLGSGARRVVEDHYSFVAHADAYYKLLSSAARDR
jgi:glycosyltransferase involved in cell wall biosynthesis